MSWWRKFVGKLRHGTHPLAPKHSDGCDHHAAAIHLRQGTPEFEEFVARGELETGQNLRHGAVHLANLMAFDPGRPEWRTLLEEYFAEAGPDFESLIPRGEKLYYGTEAVRAYAWHKQGKLADAIGLLVDVVHAKNDSAYLETWGLDWLEPVGAVESISDSHGLRLFASVWSRFPEAKRSTVRRLRQLDRWATLAERFAAAHPSTGESVMVRVGLLRKAGRFDEGVAIARSALAENPNWHTASALGLILRAQGDCPSAEVAFRRALELDPNDVTVRLEAGDMFFDRDQWQPALTWYENVLASEAGQPWALASAEYCRWKLSGDDQHLNLLTELARAENSRARFLYHRTFWGGLPEPSDATANLLRQLRERVRNDPANAPTGELRLTLSSLEAPSNFLAFRLETEALGIDLQMKVAVNRIPVPDPREPIERTTYRLWTYDGTDASPGLERPADGVLHQIAALASTTYDDDANWAAASRVAAHLGPERVGEVLATMVQPPAPPAGVGALAWLPRVQLAAAQVVAQVEERWENSARRDALFSVLLGPQDWATEAAIRVLARLGREDETLAFDIHQAFQRLADHRPDDGYCCWEDTLYRSWLELPLLFPKEREELEGKLRVIEKRVQAEEH